MAIIRTIAPIREKSEEKSVSPLLQGMMKKDVERFKKQLARYNKIKQKARRKQAI